MQLAAQPLEATTYSFPPSYPYPDKIGSLTTTGLYKDDVGIVAWATGYSDYTPGTNVDVTWQTPDEALGGAEGTAYAIVSLGRGGSITLTFDNPIADGSGYDFAVFENSFSDTFLELAWVEVSTDGIHFVRFPHYSQTTTEVGGFGMVDAYKVYGFAGKYRQGYGTPFDLTELKDAYDAAVADTTVFPAAYEASLIANFPYLDPNDIRYVRLVDVVGDGSQQSAYRNPSTDEGYPVYDPYPTNGSAGFDLDAVAVLNEALPKLPQTIFVSPVSNQVVNGAISLSGFVASSGLPVSLTVDSGPVGVSVSELSPYTLQTGATTGPVTLRVSQAGNSTYAAAEEVLVFFDVVGVDSTLAPKTLSQWQALNLLPGDATLDGDGDGASDLEEYVAGTDANDPAEKPQIGHTLSDSSIELVLTLSQLAQFDVKVEVSETLSVVDSWDAVVPTIAEQQYSDVDGQPFVTLTLELPRGDSQAKFWRLVFEAN